MKKSEKLKAAICSITNDMDMEQDTKFEVLEHLYSLYVFANQIEEAQPCDTE
ncbi:MAG: hypothetical protein ACI4XB_01145 [Ruminococcus sp.]